jgi:lipoyl(octanoyl) transferase
MATMSPGAERPLHADFLGRVPYAEAEELQKSLREAVKRGDEPEHLLLLEHPHVFTVGRNARAADVMAGREWLHSRGVQVAPCDRGGQVTYHGPGQLVGYPIVNLSPDRRDVRRYVRDLEEVLVRTLGDFGLRGRVRPGQALVGVWVGERKVAAIGVHLSRWVTTHGFALNVSTDLSFFSGIVPCGLPTVSMASVESLTGERPQVEEVARYAARHFAEIFGRQLHWGQVSKVRPGH